VFPTKRVQIFVLIFFAFFAAMPVAHAKYENSMDAGTKGAQEIYFRLNGPGIDCPCQTTNSNFLLSMAMMRAYNLGTYKHGNGFFELGGGILVQAIVGRKSSATNPRLFVLAVLSYGKHLEGALNSSAPSMALEGPVMPLPADVTPDSGRSFYAWVTRDGVSFFSIDGPLPQAPAGTTPAKPSSPAESVSFFIRAFIPSFHPGLPGYMLPVPGIPGKTMIRGPLGLDGKRWCYMTDQRGFSDSLDDAATYRVMALVTVRTIEPIAIENKERSARPTHEINCETGKLNCEGKASAHKVEFTNLRREGELVKLDFSAAAHNPCVMATLIAGDIDFRGTLSIDPAKHTVRVQATVDDFPAFEAYAYRDQQPTIRLFQIWPKVGADVTTIVGKPSREIDSGAITLR